MSSSANAARKHAFYTIHRSSVRIVTSRTLWNTGSIVDIISWIHTRFAWVISCITGQTRRLTSYACTNISIIQTCALKGTLLSNKSKQIISMRTRSTFYRRVNTSSTLRLTRLTHTIMLIIPHRHSRTADITEPIE